MSCKFLPSFKRNQEGGVLVTFAVMATVLLSLVGAGIDFAKAYSARTKLQKAADMGALAGANDPYQPEGQARDTASQFFESAKTSLVQDVKPKYTVQRDQTGSTMSVTVSAEAAVDTSLLRVMGITNLPLSVSATAIRPSNAIDIYAAIDMSASMGLAADEANRQKMKAVTMPYHGPGCVFACHLPNPGIGFGSPTTHDLARMNNVRLRRDVMQDAFGAFVDEMMNPGDTDVRARMRRISTYGFSDVALRLISLSTDTSAIKYSLGMFPDAERINTNFDNVLSTLATDAGISGSGAPTSPKKMVLIATDGVAWNWITESGGPLDPALCDRIKRNGVTLAILDVKYHKDETEMVFNVQVAPFYDRISPQLRACASPGFYFEVGDSADAQLKQAFADVARAMKPRLALVQ